MKGYLPGIIIVLFMLLLAGCKESPDPLPGKWDVNYARLNQVTLDIQDGDYWLFEEDGTIKLHYLRREEDLTGYWETPSDSNFIFMTDPDGGKWKGHFTIDDRIMKIVALGDIPSDLPEDIVDTFTIEFTRLAE